MANSTYLDFDLLIDPAVDKFKIRILNSPAGQASHEFYSPFSGKELEEFWMQIDAFDGLDKGRYEKLNKLIQDIGGRLFATVFAHPVAGMWTSSFNLAVREHKGLRVRLRLAETPALENWPWEFLFDAALQRFLSLSTQTPIVRYLDLPLRAQPLAVQLPLRILVIIASPLDLPPLDVEREWEEMRTALAGPLQRNQIQIERLPTATLAELQMKLRDQEFHMVHFVGHGSFDEQRKAGFLAFENEEGRSLAVAGEHFGALLRDEETLRMVALNACRGSRSSNQDSFSGVAQKLVQQGLPAVIAMQANISDTAALAFTKEFYSALSAGYAVDAALAESRKAIFTQGNAVEWGIPVLYMRAPDGRIFNVEQNTNLEVISAQAGIHEAAETIESRTSGYDTSKPSTQTVSHTSGGQVIQAGGDVVIQQSEGDKKDFGKRLALWLGIVATTVTIITGIFQLWPETLPRSSRFFGVVRDVRGGYVGGAEIEVSAQNNRAIIGRGTTQPNGEFSFPIKEKWEETVFVRVFKGDSVGFEGYLMLQGNQTIAFVPFKRK